MNEGRTLPAVQRAYLCVVALVAIHMVVLAVANLLRVGAEIAMNAPSGGFTGLPFVSATSTALTTSTASRRALRLPFWSSADPRGGYRSGPPTAPRGAMSR